MKKFWKILLISFGSIAGLALIAVVVALWLVFSPARLTPIVARQLPRFVTCRAEVDRVELTFFSSFPRLGLRVDGVKLVNPVPGAPCDTLVRLDRLDATVDVKAFLKRDELMLSDIVLSGGVVCLYADSLGRVNYDIVKTTPDADMPDTGGFTLARIDADYVTVENLDVRYIDDALLVKADARGLWTAVKASMAGDKIDATVATNRPLNLDFSMWRADSLLTASAQGLAVIAKVSMEGEVADVGLTGTTAVVSVTYGGEEYIKDADMSLTADVSADLAAQSADIRNAVLTLGGPELSLQGSVRNDTLRGINMDLRYKLAGTTLTELFALIPASMTHYLDGIEASGNIRADGTAVGVYGENSMPVIDANVIIEEGRVSWPEMLPWPLTGVKADLAVHTDMTDAASYTKINGISARTPRSSLKAHGTVDRLFSDPHADISADVTGDLADAKPFIPKDMNLTAKGKVSGRVTADVRMSQLERMAFEKMRLSGSLLVGNLDAVYDTISVATPSAKLEFRMPNAKLSMRQASFVEASLVSDDIAVKMGGSTDASFRGARIALETSDIRDTMNIPAVVCSFLFDGIAARTGDISVSVDNPSGGASMAPGRRSTTVPRIGVTYGSGAISGTMGGDGFSVEKVDMDATVMYDESQKYVWQMLSPRGSISVQNAVASFSTLDYPVDMPLLAMDFTPMRFNVDKARVRLDKSDFSLDGTLDNVLPYLRREGVLRGEFNFTSPVTDVTQLLALTSGIGDEEIQEEKAEADVAPDEFTGPYMVPLGIDIMLHANVGEALWDGVPLFSDITGDVQVKDGALFISPQLSFSSPATHGEIQLMYRTPDKNNLFAGVSLHLERIGMHELVSLIPDLDEMMPMLGSFDGRGEFHCAAEGYMDSTYRFKMSTLRGAGSIGATNLTLKDEELFRTVAKFMKYKDEGVIRVDSLRAEFTVFRNEIDVYPFLLSVDRYKAVISGRHNLDMNFDYNISLVQSPLPFRVAVDVKGTPDDLKFKVFSKSRYPDFYRPKYNGVVENRQLELRNIIRNSLLEGRDK